MKAPLTIINWFHLITIKMNSTHKSPKRALALQNYLLLHSQRHSLRKHLDNVAASPRPTISSPSKSADQSQHNSSVPFGSEHRYLSQHRPLALQPQQLRNGRNHKSHNIQPEAVIHEGVFEEIEDYENKLKNVIEKIRYTLMDLMKCDGVRGDKGYSTWVQSRLIDVEKELTGLEVEAVKRSNAGGF